MHALLGVGMGTDNLFTNLKVDDEFLLASVPLFKALSLLNTSLLNVQLSVTFHLFSPKRVCLHEIPAIKQLIST